MLLLKFITNRFKSIRNNIKPSTNIFSSRSTLLLAITELVMVVMGILLALYIDRWNGKAKHEDNFKAALRVVQEELSYDIKQSDRIFLNYIYRDSLRNNVFGNKLSREDYKNGISSTGLIIYYYILLNIHTDGFEILSSFNEEIPEKYKDIFYKIKRLYIQKLDIDEYNTNFKKVVWENIDYMYKRPWFPEDEFNNIVSEDQVDFYLQNPYYKSLIQNTMNSMGNTYYVSRRFRVSAIDVYKEINEVLADTMRIPEHISYELEYSLLEKYAGNYELVSGRDDSMFETDLEISIEDGNLVVLREESLLKLYYFKKTILFSSSSYIFKFNNNGELKIIGGGRESTNWRKK